MVSSNMSRRWALMVPAVVLMLSPLWTPHVQTLAGQNLFITPDSLILFGLAIAAGILAEFFLPKSYDPQFKSAILWVRFHFKWIAVFFLLALFTGLIAANRFILHSFMNSADEHSCYFLAECIKRGKFWATPHPMSEFFEAVHVGNKNGKWFSVYPPGWPLLMAAGLKAQILDYVNPALTIVSLIFIYLAAKKLFGSLIAAFGIFLAAVTPFFIFNGASYSSHASCLLMIGIFLYGYLKWDESQSQFWAFISAFAVGYGLGTRYLTMASIAAPFLIYKFIRLLTKKEKWSRSHTVFGCVLLIVLGLNFYYNFAITGNPLDAPNHFHHSWERLGFKKDYSPVTALVFVSARFFYLIDWVPAAFVVLYLISLARKKPDSPYQQLFRYGFVYLAVGYMFYYSWGGNQYGPRYYIEGLPFMFIALSHSIVDWWGKGSAAFRRFALGIVVASLLGNVYLFQKQAVFFERVSQQRKALYELADKSIAKPSIVFVRGFLGDALVMSQEDAVRNSPSLDGKILYALDLGEKNRMLKTYYPDRDFYIGTYDRKLKLPKLESYPNGELNAQV